MFRMSNPQRPPGGPPIPEVFANALLRKRTEAALREGEERLNLAAESAKIGMWALKTGGTHPKSYS